MSVVCICLPVRSSDNQQPAWVTVSPQLTAGADATADNDNDSGDLTDPLETCSDDDRGDGDGGGGGSGNFSDDGGAVLSVWL